MKQISISLPEKVIEELELFRENGYISSVASVFRRAAEIELIHLRSVHGVQEKVPIEKAV